MGELADLAGASVADGWRDLSVEAVSVLSRADAATVTFLADAKHATPANQTGAGACFVARSEAGVLPPSCIPVISAQPQMAWALSAGRLHRPNRIDPSAAPVHPSAHLEANVSLGHGVVIGEGAQIGEGTMIGPGAVIGPGVAIGRGCAIEARAVIGFALIGDGVRICAGAIIGEAGFGVTPGPRGLMDVPQMGRVILQDGVAVGANSCIDRGAFDDTVIGENTKIDNLVQIGHNVTIGRNCVLVAFAGVSGSVKIGDGVQIGGAAGLADHLTVGDGARLAARTGLISNVPAGETWGGYPARPARQFFREQAWLKRAAARRKAGDEA